MKKKVIIGIVIVMLGIILVVITNLRDRIPDIDGEDVAKVYYKDFRTGDSKDLDVDIFLQYYNKIYDVKDTKDDASTTPESAIIIELKNGEEITICDQQKKFHINFKNNKGEWKQYWGKQKEIHNMLRYGEYEIEE